MTTLEKAAHDIGAKGSEPTEAERLAFESWMRGHCWKVEGSWDGKQYVHAHESTGFVHGGAMNTRRLWAAWRDRGAVARVLAEQAQAVEPLLWVRKDQLNQMASGFLLSAYRSTEGRTDLTPVFAHPAPPAGEVPAGIKELLSAKPITGPCGQCKSSADPCYCGNVNTGECAELVELPVAFGEIQYQRPSGQWGRIEGYTRNQMREAVAAAVAKAEAKHAQQVAVPYDQQALELCPACGWKAIIPGEPCLNCGRGEVMKALDAYAAERDALMADAARYQFMKSCTRAAGLDISGWHSWTCQIMRSDIKGATLDQAIDAAIKKAGAETKTDWSAA